MDSTSQELNFHKLQELVYDEDKIVTVLTAAFHLNIPVQDSREILKSFVKDIRQLKPNDLALTYVLQGILKDTTETGIILVKESNLNEQRKLFKQIQSEILYSIQKSKDIDYNILCLANREDKNESNENIFIGSQIGLISSKNCVKRIIKHKKLPSPPKPAIGGKGSIFIKSNSKQPERSIEKSVASSSKQELKHKANGNIASLFTNAAAKSSQNGVSKKVEQTKTASKPKGMSGFLLKGSPKSDNVKNEKQDEEIEVVDVIMKDESPEKSEKENDSISANIKVKSEEKKSKKRKGKDNKGPTNSNKRRKRIVHQNDSDSDDIFQEDPADVEDIIDKSDEETESVPTFVSQPIVPKNKRRKAVERTYEDEEGFVVTKTEYVYETPSEDENEEPPPPPPQPKKEPPPSRVLEKKASSNSETEETVKGGKNKKKGKKAPSGNQQTLMNFFAKK